MLENKQFDPASYFAFFDVDETIINVKSMFSFLRFHLLEEANLQLTGLLKYYLAYYRLKFLSNLGKPREFINSEYYRLYMNKEENVINSLGKKWFLAECKKGNFFNQHIVEEIQYHKKNRANIVFVSGSFDACLFPIANYLGADKILATRLEVADGKYTGKILPPQTIGKGKAEAVQLFLQEANYNNYEKCFAYGDHISDLPMLKLVGNPVIVAKCDQLEAYAKSAGWRIIYSQ